mmetsp:Transcript_26786/g.63539  ORF Transcript_26786/g.63539 Transcript_26786/m.63539 type:complete len:445 (+) Transcript_26786:450-1784(+)
MGVAQGGGPWGDRIGHKGTLLLMLLETMLLVEAPSRGGEHCCCCLLRRRRAAVASFRLLVAWFRRSRHVGRHRRLRLLDRRALCRYPGRHRARGALGRVQGRRVAHRRPGGRPRPGGPRVANHRPRRVGRRGRSHRGSAAGHGGLHARGDGRDDAVHRGRRHRGGPSSEAAPRSCPGMRPAAAGAGVVHRRRRRRPPGDCAVAPRGVGPRRDAGPVDRLLPDRGRLVGRLVGGRRGLVVAGEPRGLAARGPRVPREGGGVHPRGRGHVLRGLAGHEGHRVARGDAWRVARKGGLRHAGARRDVPGHPRGGHGHVLVRAVAADLVARRVGRPRGGGGVRRAGGTGELLLPEVAAGAVHRAPVGDVRPRPNRGVVGRRCGRGPVCAAGAVAAAGLGARRLRLRHRLCRVPEHVPVVRIRVGAAERRDEGVRHDGRGGGRHGSLGRL